MYGTQTKPMPGAPSIGFGPNGQVYDPSNPVSMTTSGMRPSSVLAAAQRGVTASNPTGASIGWGMGQSPGGPMQTQAPNPFRHTGGSYDAPGSRPGSGAMGWPGGAVGATQPQGGLGGMLGSYASGITAGQIPNSVIQSGMQNFGFGSAPGVPVSAAGASSIGGQFNDLMSQGLQTAGLDFARNAAFEQSQLDLARQRAQSDSGIGFGNLLARLYESQSGGQNSQANIVQNLLMGLI